MSKKTVTTSENKTSFNPASMGVFNSLQPQIGSTLSQFMGDPRTSPWVMGMQQLAAKQAQRSGQAQMSNVSRNLSASGWSGGTLPAWAQTNIARTGSDTIRNTGTGQWNALLAGYDMQRQGAGQAQGYNPLVTGGTANQTETVSGLGSWLPQLLGAGLGAASGIMTGGAGKFSKLGAIAGGASSAFGSAMQLGMPKPNTPFGGNIFGVGQSPMQAPNMGGSWGDPLGTVSGWNNSYQPSYTGPNWNTFLGAYR